ncbi:uncharacterized protein LOC143253308 [Tachypleus tridentatus]|uniref:uncharacterized protein LOC143253308 n=1 Tax=Tachypleus tridentatus TaxID=6853 RepID=UPI003FCF2E84
MKHVVCTIALSACFISVHAFSRKSMDGLNRLLCRGDNISKTEGRRCIQLLPDSRRSMWKECRKDLTPKFISESGLDFSDNKTFQESLCKPDTGLRDKMIECVDRLVSAARYQLREFLKTLSREELHKERNVYREYEDKTRQSIHEAEECILNQIKKLYERNHSSN